MSTVGAMKTIPKTVQCPDLRIPSKPTCCLLPAHQDQRQDFNESGERGFPSYDIRELVNWQWDGDGVRGREGLLELVEAVGDSYLFHDIALVEDIWARCGDADGDLVGWHGWVGGGCDRAGVASHLVEQVDDLGLRE